MCFKTDLCSELHNLRGYALNLCRNHHDAEDLVQETLVRALANQHKFESGTCLQAWLFTIMRNQFITGKRQAHRIVEDIGGLYAERTPTQPVQEWHVQLSQLGEALDRVSPILREALILKGILGMEFQELAEEIHRPVGTAKSRVRLAREKVAEFADVD